MLQRCHGRSSSHEVLSGFTFVTVDGLAWLQRVHLLDSHDETKNTHNACVELRLKNCCWSCFSRLVTVEDILRTGFFLAVTNRGTLAVNFLNMLDLRLSLIQGMCTLEQ